MNKLEKLNLKKINVKINELLLDANNPRFSKHQDEITPDGKIEDKDIQEETFRRMVSPKNNFEIKELINSMKSKGFVPVDNIFVRKVKTKYLVIEGNRRITAAKVLLQKHNEGKPKDILSEDTIKSLEILECFDLTNNSSDDIDFILGIRHHGSIMDWNVLPSSFNLYKRYMKEFCSENECENIPEEFSYNAKIAKKIASLYSLKPTEVKYKLRAYRVYLQLKILIDYDLESKFAIIHDAVNNKTLRENEFEFDDELFIFSEEGADKFIDLVCGKDDKDPVITQASAGESNLRDFAYIVAKGDDEDKRRIYEEREQPSSVKGDIKAKINERTLALSLEYALIELEKIKLGEDFEELGESEKETLKEIQEIINKIKTLSNKN